MRMVVLSEVGSVLMALVILAVAWITTAWFIAKLQNRTSVMKTLDNVLNFLYMIFFILTIVSIVEIY